jgi:hypothetical protein
VASAIAFPRTQWTLVTAQQIVERTNRKAKKEEQIRRENCQKTLSVENLIHSDSDEREHLYTIAYEMICTGKYFHAIAILEDLIKKPSEIKYFQLLAYGHQQYGIHLKSGYHLECALNQSISMLQTTPLCDKDRAEFIIYAADSFKEMMKFLSRDKILPSIFFILSIIDPPAQLNIPNERKAELALSVGNLWIIAGKLFSSHDATRPFFPLQINRAIALFTTTLNSKELTPNIRAHLLFNLSSSYHLIGDHASAMRDFNSGFLLAKNSAPELLGRYRILESEILPKQTEKLGFDGVGSH